MSEVKIAVLKQEVIEHGYIKFTMTYPSGKTFSRQLDPGSINEDNDLRNSMCAWAEERGFEVHLDLEGAIIGE